jgi:hypothetical protein
VLAHLSRCAAPRQLVKIGGTRGVVAGRIAHFIGFGAAPGRALKLAVPDAHTPELQLARNLHTAMGASASQAAH